MKQNNSKNKGVKRLLPNAYVRNIVYAVFIFVAVFFATKWFLMCITRHGESKPVPDFIGLHIEDAEYIADKNNLKLSVNDSIFISNAPPGTVLDQHPKAETHVKTNRMIYLTINCITPKKIEVPNVVGHSLRQAKAVLNSKGIYVGKITYRDDMAMNNVIGQISKDVETGNYISHTDSKIPTVYFGDEIELILGLGSKSDEQNTVVPNVVGKDIRTAKNLIIESYLNIGSITYDSTVQTPEEKRNAVVKTQTPNSNARRSLGETVNLILTVNQ